MSEADTFAGRRGPDTRARLIQAAYDQFIQHGYHGTSMRQIARQAGVAVGGIYNHFASKDEVFAAVLDAYHPYHVIFPALQAAQGDSLEAFLRTAGRNVETAVRGSEDRLMPLVFIELVEFQGRHLAALAERLFATLMEFVQGVAERSQEVRPGLPVPVILRAYINSLIGYLVTQYVARRSPIFAGLDYDWLGGTLDILLHGILAEPGSAPEQEA